MNYDDKLEKWAELAAEAVSVAQDQARTLTPKARLSIQSDLKAASDLIATIAKESDLEYIQQQCRNLQTKIAQLKMSGKKVCEVCGRVKCLNTKSCGAKRSAQTVKARKAAELQAALKLNANCEEDDMPCAICPEIIRCGVALKSGVSGGQYLSKKKDRFAPTTEQIEADRKAAKEAHGVIVTPSDIH